MTPRSPVTVDEHIYYLLLIRRPPPLLTEQVDNFGTRNSLLVDEYLHREMMHALTVMLLVIF